MTERNTSEIGPASLIVGARLINMLVGLVTIPMLIHFLGGTGFAAWAVLLALAAGFSLLEVTMPTVVQFLLTPVAAGDWNAARALLSRVWVLLAIAFGAGLIVIALVAEPLARWLRLPDTASFTGGGAMCVVFVAVAMRAFLQTGTHMLYASRRFYIVAGIELLQPLVSNITAIWAAWRFSQLDVTLLSYWTAQLAVVGSVFICCRHRCAPHFVRSMFDLTKLRELWVCNLSAQLHQWAQFINFQFDKFVIAGLVGLWAVAPYEVANRSVLALRSLPASSEGVFLPDAVMKRGSPDETWSWYTRSTRFAAYGVSVFMLAPIAIAPIFLYAWTGEMGYVGRWAFVALIIGAMANMLALPAAILAQVAALPGLPAKAAITSIVLNVPISIFLTVRWGLTGAAIGTGMVMVVSASGLLYSVHRHCNKPLAGTLRMLRDFWPAITICAAWALIAALLFGDWVASLEPASRFARANRFYPAILAVLMYFACLATMVVAFIAVGSLTSDERAVLARKLGPKWGARYLRAGTRG